MTHKAPGIKQLTVNQLKALRMEMSQAYDESMTKVEDEFQQGNITQTQFDRAVDELQKLKLQLMRLLGAIMTMKLNALLNVDIDSPTARIGIAINKLEKASQKIDKFSAFLQSVAEVIQIATGLIVAIQTGSIAKIANALDSP